MTMPVKIWIDAAFGGKWSQIGGGTQCDEYIRADIAEELARALFNVCLGIEQDGELPYDAAQSALARYNEATKCSQ